jgi:Kef-type K+ transport system membrane component KefB
VCAIAGALLINLPYQNVERLKATLAQVERPLYMILLVIAGALWDPTAWQGWALVPIFVAARVAGKIMGARVAKRVGPKELPDATTLGLALSPQSPVAIATIVSYYAIYRTQTENAANLPWLMTATIGGAVLTELTVQILVRMRGGLRFELGSLSIPPPSVRPVAMVNDPGHEPAIPTPAALPKIADPSSDQGEGY